MPKVWFKAGILLEILEEFVCRRCGYTWKTEGGILTEERQEAKPK